MNNSTSDVEHKQNASNDDSFLKKFRNFSQSFHSKVWGDTKWAQSFHDKVWGKNDNTDVKSDSDKSEK